MTKSRAFWPLAMVCVISLAGNFYLLHQRSAAAFVPYRPVYIDVRAPDVLRAYQVNYAASNEAHLAKVRLVLDHWKYDYKYADGELLIRRELWDNKAEMANITRWARDYEWLTQVGGYKVDMTETDPREGPTFEELKRRVDRLREREAEQHQ